MHLAPIDCCPAALRVCGAVALQAAIEEAQLGALELAVVCCRRRVTLHFGAAGAGVDEMATVLPLADALEASIRLEPWELGLGGGVD